MTDTPSRMFGLVCVLILIWVGVYWLYEPRSGPAGGAPTITRDVGVPAQPQPRPTPVPAPPSAAKPEPGPPAAAPEPVAATQGPRTRVVPPQFRDYVVQRGDVSFEAVAQRVFNDRKKWSVIAQANPLVSSDRLKAGKTVLKIPLDPDNIQGKVVVEGGGPSSPGRPSAAPPESPKAPPGETTYVVQADDTLWSISKKVYGKGGLWRTVYQANRDVIKDPDRPVAGTVLKVPARPKE